ncbi:unnamed protein product [Urochloa decumbens]|uniref:Uncharacterized protein n=1 Tax=Urochloa decumbens TaxID=240449 RepID=A0ABC8VBT1_9POAL
MQRGAMDCGGGVAPANVYVAYVDGERVLIPNAGGHVERAGGFTFPANEAQRAAAKEARQMDHYRRVRAHARRMPELARLVGGEDALADLMYGDVDVLGRVIDGAPVAPGVYAAYVPN